jgi:FkbM family methyltransferase
MNTFQIKVLAKLRLLRYLNLQSRLPAARGAFNVPINGGMGTGHLYDAEPWLNEILKLLLSSKSGAFLDIGVNTGQTLVKVRSCDAKRDYYGFEPSPACCAYVNKLKELNSFKQVQLLPIALSNETRLGQLYGRNDADAAASILPDFRAGQPGQGELQSQFVPFFRGDDVIDELGLNELAIVKIDVEGAELEVIGGLQSTLSRYRPYILCEVLPIHDETSKNGMNRRARTDELLRLLSQLDYHIARILHGGVLQRLDWIETHSNLDLCEYVFYPSEQEWFAAKCVESA